MQCSLMSAKCLISHIHVSDIVSYTCLDENIAALGKMKADEGPKHDNRKSNDRAQSPQNPHPMLQNSGIR